MQRISTSRVKRKLLKYIGGRTEKQTLLPSHSALTTTNTLPSSSAMAITKPLLSLPNDILVLLPEHLHSIEDYTNLAATCRTLRECMQAASPNTILRLAAAQTRTFFRPSPHFLVAATARELGNWARLSDENETEFALRCQDGVDGLLDLALEHCGLTMTRIRELHQMRFDIINPVTDIIDKCVGKQWYSTPNFWNGGVDDAYTIDGDPPETFFHLAIYGELFAPDFEAILNQDADTRRLSVDTRLEFMKYCVPDRACGLSGRSGDPDADPRRAAKEVGPYAGGFYESVLPQHNLALTWVINSSRWKPYWKEVRAEVGPDFEEDFDDGWWYDEDSTRDWRQRMWEDIMVCQGLHGLEMMRPGMRDAWIPKVKEWRAKIEALGGEPPTVRVGRQATLEYPYLLGDLRICASGYVLGT